MVFINKTSSLKKVYHHLKKEDRKGKRGKEEAKEGLGENLMILWLKPQPEEDNFLPHSWLNGFLLKTLLGPLS